MKITSSKKILGISCVLFFTLGILTAALGPLMAELAVRNQAPLAALGSVYSAIFLGALFSQVISGWLGDRWGEKPLLVISSLVLAFGLVGMSLSRNLSLSLTLAFVAGLGHGAVDLCANVLIARLYSRRGVSALNLLNVFFGLGAFTGPAVVSLGQRLWQSGLLSLWIGSGVLAIAALVMLYASPQYEVKLSGEKSVYRDLYSSGLLWAIGLMVLIYVGTENAVGGWTTTYLEQTTGMLLEQAAMITAGFWLALTAGRTVSAALGTRLSANMVLIISLAEALGGSILFILGRGHVLVSIIAVLLVGFGFGAIFPTALAITTHAFPAAPGKAGSMVTAMGSVGGMLLPWLQGNILAYWGAQAAGISILAAVLMMLLLFIASRKGRHMGKTLAA